MHLAVSALNVSFYGFWTPRFAIQNHWHILGCFLFLINLAVKQSNLTGRGQRSPNELCCILILALCSCCIHIPDSDDHMCGCRSSWWPAALNFLLPSLSGSCTHDAGRALCSCIFLSRPLDTFPVVHCQRDMSKPVLPLMTSVYSTGQESGLHRFQARREKRTCRYMLLIARKVATATSCQWCCRKRQKLWRGKPKPQQWRARAEDWDAGNWKEEWKMKQECKENPIVMAELKSKPCWG